MTTPAALPPGAYDRRRARRASGILAQANDAGILSAADVHVASRLSALTGESDPEVVLALALATRAVREGSVALDLTAAGALLADTTEVAGSSAVAVPGVDPARAPVSAWPADAAAWLAKVEASPLVAQGILRVDFGLIYLHRYWAQERAVAQIMADRMAGAPVAVREGALAAGLDRLFGPADREQRDAAELAVRAATVIVTGGPGTGKTTTVAKILALLAEQAEAADGFAQPRFALVAPTAKAASRLSEAYAAAARALPETDRARLPALTASTVHRLLGWNPHSRSRFRHGEDNRLPLDVVVLDEASMVSLTLMTRLLQALRPQTRLIIVGDPDQLSSVEAGAVLADLVAALSRWRTGPGGPPVARLTHVYRFAGAIHDLAAAVREGDADAALAVLSDPAQDEVRLEADPLARRGVIVDAALGLREAARAGDADAALEILGRHRLLCAHRSGPVGVSWWNRQVEQWLSEETGDPHWHHMYAGRPLLVTANDYGLGLFNGDTGVVVIRPDPDGRRDRLIAAFDGGDQVKQIAAARLSDVETMFAATVHKSQGSQAREVTVILPEADSPLLTRELIYTAITRAQSQVTLIGTPDALRAGLARRTMRPSGLRQRLEDPGASTHP